MKSISTLVLFLLMSAFALSGCMATTSPKSCSSHGATLTEVITPTVITKKDHSPAAPAPIPNSATVAFGDKSYLVEMPLVTSPHDWRFENMVGNANERYFREGARFSDGSGNDIIVFFVRSEGFYTMREVTDFPAECRDVSDMFRFPEGHLLEASSAVFSLQRSAVLPKTNAIVCIKSRGTNAGVLSRGMDGLNIKAL